MGLWTAVRNHWQLVLVGVIGGALLAFFWTYQVTSGDSGTEIVKRSPETYTTSLTTVVDTTDFGIGRSDTNMNNLADLSPTYAQLLTSEPILRAAEASLGTSIDANAIAGAVEPGSPIIKITVQGRNPETLGRTATAVLGAFQEYVAAQQQQSRVPADLRLTLRGIGLPTTPVRKSNREAEIALVLFLLPVAAAVALAMRFEAVAEPVKVEQEQHSFEPQPE